MSCNCNYKSFNLTLADLNRTYDLCAYGLSHDAYISAIVRHILNGKKSVFIMDKEIDPELIELIINLYGSCGMTKKIDATTSEDLIVSPQLSMTKIIEGLNTHETINVNMDGHMRKFITPSEPTHLIIISDGNLKILKFLNCLVNETLNLYGSSKMIKEAQCTISDDLKLISLPSMVKIIEGLNTHQYMPSTYTAHTNSYLETEETFITIDNIAIFRSVSGMNGRSRSEIGNTYYNILSEYDPLDLGDIDDIELGMLDGEIWTIFTMIKKMQCTISDDLVVLPQLSIYKQFTSDIKIEESNVIDLSLLKNISSNSDFTLPSSSDMHVYQYVTLGTYDPLDLNDMDNVDLGDLDRVLIA